MTESAHEERVAARRWGAWESAATVLVFCVPAAVASGLPRTPEGAGWGLLVSGGVPEGVLAAVAAFALTLWARGLKGAQAFLTVGVATCLTWFVAGWLGLGRGGSVRPYGVLTGALLVAHYHTVPVTLWRAARLTDTRTGADGGGSASRRRSPSVSTHGSGRRALRRSVAGVAASVAALDLGLLVALAGDLFAPSERWLLVGLAWAIAAVASGGAFATLAAWQLPAFRSGGAISRQGAVRPAAGVAEDAGAEKDPGEPGALVPTADPGGDHGR